LEKAPDAFRTISEVADEIDVPQHVLRFWESRFTQIRPMKRGGGRRYYRPDDVDLLRGVRHLLYGEGYTIRGVQRILREHGATFVQEVWRGGALPEKVAEDQVEEEFGDEASAPRAEPNLFVFSPEGDAATTANAASERREPALAPAASVAPVRQVAAEGRRKLEAALDELVACRALIEGALRQDGPQD
jgi:DNA-binding transcriptional MerR regulator